MKIKGMPAQCEDCKRTFNEAEMYFVREPYKEDDWGQEHARKYNLCESCWSDR